MPPNVLARTRAHATANIADRNGRRGAHRTRLTSVSTVGVSRRSDTWRGYRSRDGVSLQRCHGRLDAIPPAQLRLAFVLSHEARPSPETGGWHSLRTRRRCRRRRRDYDCFVGRMRACGGDQAHTTLRGRWCRVPIRRSRAGDDLSHLAPLHGYTRRRAATDRDHSPLSARSPRPRTPRRKPLACNRSQPGTGLEPGACLTRGTTVSRRFLRPSSRSVLAQVDFQENCRHGHSGFYRHHCCRAGPNQRSSATYRGAQPPA